MDISQKHVYRRISRNLHSQNKSLILISQCPPSTVRYHHSVLSHLTQMYTYHLSLYRLIACGQSLLVSRSPSSPCPMLPVCSWCSFTPVYHFKYQTLSLQFSYYFLNVCCLCQYWKLLRIRTISYIVTYFLASLLPAFSSSWPRTLCVHSALNKY